jgi:hypothetical protein
MTALGPVDDAVATMIYRNEIAREKAQGCTTQ